MPAEMIVLVLFRVSMVFIKIIFIFINDLSSERLLKII